MLDHLSRISQTKRIASAITAFAIVCSTSAHSEVIPIANGDLNLRGQVVQDEAANLARWEVSGEGETKPTAWLAAEPAGWSVELTTNAVLSQKITIPALPEGRDAANWYGLISIDLLGAGDGRGRAGYALELVDSATGNRIARDAGFVGLEAQGAIENQDEAAEGEINDAIERGWLYLSPEQMEQLAGKEIEIRLVGLTERGVVVDSVHFYRLHALPTRRLQAKPNGVNGPDFLDAGALGFSALTQHQHAPLPVIGVTENGPADEAHLRPGDCIIEINQTPLAITSCAPGWQWFNDGHEASLGRAVEAAFDDDLPRSRQNVVELTILRNGERARVRIRLPEAEPFAESFPFDDPKALEMYADIVTWVANAQHSDGSWDRDPKRTCLGALTLLGTHDPQYAQQIKAAMDWMINRHPNPNAFGNLGYWGASYGGILAAEYHLATGDERVLPWMERILIWAHNGHHNSKWDLPTLGHGPGGLPYGNKALVAPAVHLLVFDALAQRCGIDSPYHDLIMPTLIHAWSDPATDGHGALGYNASYKDLGEFWSRTGLFSLALTLRDEHPEMRGPLTDIMDDRYPWLRNSHAYGEPGGALGLIGLSVADPEDFAHVMRELRWTFALAWEPGHGLHFTQPHMGAPYMGEQMIVNTAYGTLFSVINHGLHITGSTQRNWLDVSAIPTALTPIALQRNRAGEVSLACRVPGPAIRYTLDGSTPTAASTLYESSFALPIGGMIRAVAIDEAGAVGEAVESVFGLSKERWSIVEATGAPTPEQAAARAGAAIDGDQGIPWITDAGQAAVIYPHHIVIDLGQRIPITEVRLQFQGKDQSPAELAVFVSDEANEFGDANTRETYTEYQANRTVSLDEPMWGRYLKIETTTGLSARPMLIVAEVDVQSVLPEMVTLGDSTISLTAPEGFTIRYTTNGSTPTAQSPAYDNPIELGADQRLLARCFAEGFASAVVTLKHE